ncbi:MULTISPECIES: ribonuclease HI [unclassified Halomonas]|uniref:Ribonuclease H n=1 Tax=Halomonas litopenaei TaxID=2109328 RepID=A0ABX5ISB6_9GAMM|nr:MULTISPECIES: ribonuclease HI [unclassified Halomonas]MAY71999.1 ribonuclease HI [Halomonas sp.]MBR9770995.1 ribonuclease HI [Gammaproteobacteria bacterium]MBS8268134.1 ribonuclease HI [Halomonas litopenaei]PTL89852.1 ribonuclease HI [Halomonas sp. SYSU XM8]RQW69557.1 ribonuclease HI [Halomonas sp. YLB-10]
MTTPDSLPVVTIYTDGGCRGNPGPGGWGALLESGDHRKSLKGAERDTTNNRMELTAAIMALKTLKRECHVDLWTDSEYLRKGITEWIHGWIKRGWKTASRQPVKNADLWRELHEQTRRHQVSWHWVKGHSGHPGNEAADALVNEAIDELLEGA